MVEMLKVCSPYDLSLINEIPLTTEEGVEQALNRAHAVFKDRQARLPLYQRIDILTRLGDLMEEKRELLAQMALLEGGKPYQDTCVEVDRALEGIRLGIQAIHALHGSEVRTGLTKSSVGRMATSFFEPIGPVVSLSAFNHPLNLIVHQTIPAIAAGCPFIVKPARATPMTCLEFVRLLHEAGLPEAWGQVVITSGEQAGRMACDPRVQFVSFIGSASIGWGLRSKLPEGTRCALEHGGVAPVILDKGLDLESLVAPLVKGAYYHAGQVCVSVQRVFVPNEDLDATVQALCQAAEGLVVGDPALPETEVGPLITPADVERVDSWVGEALDEGATIACGGSCLSETMYRPTVLVNPSRKSKVSSAEIFGPVMCVYGYDDRDAAIDQANSLPYAFQASVFSNDIDVVLDTVQKLNASTVMVNDHTAFRVDWMPFGGRQRSGLGTGGIAQTAREMSQEKLMVIKSKFL